MFHTDKIKLLIMSASMNQEALLKFISIFGPFSITNSNDSVGSC